MIVLDHVEKPEMRGQVVCGFLGVDQFKELVVVTADDFEEGFVGLFVGQNELLGLLHFAHLQADVEFHLIERG